MAHEASRRSEQVALNKAKNKYKRQARSKKNIENGYARNTREQGGEMAMNKIFTAQEHVIRAMTHSVKKPEIDQETGEQITDQRKESPRVRHLYVVINEVGETPMNGGKMKGGSLRRDKIQILYCSSYKKDAQIVWDTMTDAQANPDNYEKVKIYGVGELGLQKLDWHKENRQKRRSRAIRAATNLQESQQQIPEELAPTVEV
jgi:hypothetical protein